MGTSQQVAARPIDSSAVGCRDAKGISLGLASLTVALCIAGCGDKPLSEEALPAASTENCTDEKLLSMHGEKRRAMASACARRSTFKPSTPRAW